MTKKEIENLTNEGFEILEHLRLVIKEDVRIEMEFYKKGVSSRDTWCCDDMKSFINKAYHINAPTETDSPYGTAYSLYNHTMLYCPFCGVKV